ncbi:MAG: peroxide stress protein YaaA [Lachnospiraceae bacterium]|nr:peroxide stress protein YaaA [Lachnospiraceae bacterium]
MKIIISPAKKMCSDVEYPAPVGLPVFVERTRQLMCQLQSMSYEELKKLWACNDEIASQNVERLQQMDLQRGAAALVSYVGIQYQYMAPRVFEDAYYAYVQEHLRILSGFYGIVRPLDCVTPYRLEMQAKLKTEAARNLYQFWGDSLYQELTRDDHMILNLASHEYSKCIEKYLTPDDTYITCIFGQLIDGKVKEKGVYVKMARGEMVRYLAERGAQSPEEAKKFDRLGFRYHAEYSDDKKYVFLME